MTLKKKMTAIARLRQEHASLCLIALTGDDDAGLHRAVRQAGADAVLEKGEIVFLQAEDGIRVGRVTGVQTCALPISCCVDRNHPIRCQLDQLTRAYRSRSEGRSEERRVGKECRFRWSPYH